jgi:hypothetical protein
MLFGTLTAVHVSNLEKMFFSSVDLEERIGMALQLKFNCFPRHCIVIAHII